MNSSDTARFSCLSVLAFTPLLSHTFHLPSAVALLRARPWAQARHQLRQLLRSPRLRPLRLPNELQIKLRHRLLRRLSPRPWPHLLRHRPLLLSLITAAVKSGPPAPLAGLTPRRSQKVKQARPAADGPRPLQVSITPYATNGALCHTDFEEGEAAFVMVLEHSGTKANPSVLFQFKDNLLQ